MERRTDSVRHGSAAQLNQESPMHGRRIRQAHPLVPTLMLLAAALNGCDDIVFVPDGGGSPGDVVVTDVPVQDDGLVAAGDGIIAFGNDSGGVSYIVVGEDIEIPIPGDFFGDAVYCAGSKIVLVADGPELEVNVYDTLTETLTPIPDTDVFDISPGSYLENDYIAVEGDFVAFIDRNGGNPVLKVVDVGPDIPWVTCFTFPFLSPQSVEIDHVAGQVVVLDDNESFVIFALTDDPDAIPNVFDLAASDGLTIDTLPKPKTDGGVIIFRDFDSGDIVLLDTSVGVPSFLLENPWADFGVSNLDIRGGLFAYFVDRPGEEDADPFQGSRVVVGDVFDPDVLTPGDGFDLGDGVPAGFGRSVAIAPDGSAVYLAGRMGQSPGGGVNEPSILQSDLGDGFDAEFDEFGDFVAASDVSVSSTAIAFKVDAGGSSWLGYIEP